MDNGESKMTTEVIAKPDEYRYRIIDFDLYDGDTFYCHCDMSMKVKVDTGFGRFVTLDMKHEEKFTVRLYGYDTPELRGGTDQSKAAGQLAKAKVVEWVKMAQVRGDCWFVSQYYQKGKYGRPMGDLFDCDGNKVSTYLVENRLAVPYHGQAKAKIQAQHDENLQYLIEQGLI